MTEVKTKLRIMFDLHGVSEEMPELIKPMMKTFRNQGHVVIICSGSPTSKLIKELFELGYKPEHHYDHVVSVVDYLRNQGVVFTYDEKGDPWTDDETWFRSKGQIAKELEVNLVIDDTERYREYMPEGIKFWLVK
jgi:hypothetical protein